MNKLSVDDKLKEFNDMIKSEKMAELEIILKPFIGRINNKETREELCIILGKLL